MTEQELKEYIAKYFPLENEGCEWKEFKDLKHSVSGNVKDDIVSYISAISNMNGGYLIIGVKDKSLDIIGIQNFYDYTPENLKFRIADHCANLPAEGLEVTEYKTSDTNKTVWIIRIPKHMARQPVYAHGKAWQRIGDSLVALTKERHNAIVSEMFVPEDWTAGIIPEATVEDLDKKAIQKAREQFKIRNPKYAVEADVWDDEKFLNKAKITIQGKITRAALILLGKSESEHFINPGVIKIRWSLKKHNGENKDYEIFSMPMIFAVDELYAKIRNIRYISVRPDSLFPEEMMRYDTFTIREPLHNCIAHQDYTKGARIEVVEYEDEKLIFQNAGTFIPKSIESVVLSDCPESVYRNPFLVEAMRNINMIETQGGGILKLFSLQRDRRFPLPEYDFSDGKVKVEIQGNVLDENFANMLSKNADLSLQELIALDKIQKNKQITEQEILMLRSKKMIEGRKPHFYISSTVAAITGKESEYIKQRGIDDEYCRKIIIDYLVKFKEAKKSDLEEILIEKLPDVLDVQQKKNKIKNNLQVLKKNGIIINDGKIWKMSKSK